MSKMKMSDVFALPVYRGVQEVNIHNKEKPCIVSGTSTTVIARPKYIEATIHAINNHDRMVEEIAELRASEADLVNRNEDLLCIIDDLTRIARALDKPEKHTNSQHKRAKRDLCKLLAKLNQEGEE